jgi:hypothetical protein
VLGKQPHDTEAGDFFQRGASVIRSFRQYEELILSERRKRPQIAMVIPSTVGLEGIQAQT